MAPNCVRIKKSKAVPLQAWTGPWGSGRLRPRIFLTFGTSRWYVVSLTHRPALLPGIFLVLIFRGWIDPRAHGSVGSLGKNPQWYHWGSIPRPLVAQCLNHYATNVLLVLYICQIVAHLLENKGALQRDARCWQFQNLKLYLSTIHYNIILPSTPMSPNYTLFCSYFPTKISCHFLTSPVCFTHLELVILFFSSSL
jgi:hypothetical protein